MSDRDSVAEDAEAARLTNDAFAVAASDASRAGKGQAVLVRSLAGTSAA